MLPANSVHAQHRLGPRRSTLAWVWALIVLGCALHLTQVWRGSAVRFDSDLLSLLPRAQDDAAAEALSRLSEGAARRVVIVLAGKDANAVQRAAAQVQTTFVGESSPLQPLSSAALGLKDIVAFYAPYRAGLLDPKERARIDGAAPATLAQQALARLYRPGAGLRALELGDDPGGSFSAWLAARAAATPLRPLGDSGFLGMQVGGAQLIVLPYELTANAMSVSVLEQLSPRIAQARELASRFGVELLTAGVPVHAAVAAERAQFEMSTIGLGSMLVIALLMVISFRSPRPLLMVLGSVLIGVLVALSVSLLVFDRVHLITLVFGASLVGVAEDYGIHYVAIRALGRHERSQIVRANANPQDLVRELWPSLSLAFGTSALGYLGLAVAPFPGLRQMAVFSVVGLFAALVTVMLWFPLAEGQAIRPTAFSRWIAATRRHWPSLRATRTTALAALLSTVFIAGGLWHLSTSDDLRAMQSAPADLVSQQQRISAWLAEASPVQFFRVMGADAETVLQREDALTGRLATLQSRGEIAGFRAISDWVPSRQQQLADRARSEKQQTAVLPALAEALGEAPTATTPANDEPLDLDTWAAHPLSEPLRPLWLGQVGDGVASVVMISGLKDPKQLPLLAAQADNLPGVRWIDKIADYSALLRTYRVAMSAVLAAALMLVWLVLLPTFGRAAWRVLFPTLFTVLLVLAGLGYVGVPLSLFHILGLLVLLGMGTDYGIFLQEDDPTGAPWLAVGLGAISTLLAFGLLAFSHTPALAAFGSTLLLGIAVVWLLSPCLSVPSLDSPDEC